MSSHKTYAEQAPGATGADPQHPAEADFGFEILDAEAGLVKPRGAIRKKIALCGFAASTRGLAPFPDPAYEIWALNQLYRHIPRVSRHFDIHANWREDNVEGTDHPGWLAQCGVPVYMTQREPTIPTSVRYPIERVIEKVAGIDYFTSTVAFMLGLAILEIDEQVEAGLAAAEIPLTFDKARRTVADAYAAREIAIFGIDLVVGTEYDYQKACVEFLLGLAQARGITIRIPPQSALLKQQWRYGYEKEPEAWPIRLTELQRRGSALVGEKNKLIAQLQTIDGALQEVGYWQQISDLRLKGATVRLNEATSS